MSFWILHGIYIKQKLVGRGSMYYPNTLIWVHKKTTAVWSTCTFSREWMHSESLRIKFTNSTWFCTHSVNSLRCMVYSFHGRWRNRNRSWGNWSSRTNRPFSITQKLAFQSRFSRRAKSIWYIQRYKLYYVNIEYLNIEYVLCIKLCTILMSAWQCQKSMKQIYPLNNCFNKQTQDKSCRNCHCWLGFVIWNHIPTYVCKHRGNIPNNLLMYVSTVVTTIQDTSKSVCIEASSFSGVDSLQS